MIQGDIAVTERPYIEIANKLKISEQTLLENLNNLCKSGVIRRFGATIRHQKSGFAANAMVGWIVDKELADQAGQKMAAYTQVTHCYQRNPVNGWPYNLYTMVHAKDEETCREIVAKISKETSIEKYIILFSRMELKKTSMNYFPSYNQPDNQSDSHLPE